MSRELDVQIATEVFGLVKCINDHKGAADPERWEYCYARPESPDRGSELHGYSEYLDSAFEVEAWLFVRGYRLNLRRRSDGKWEALVGSMLSTGNILPEAICRVALEVARLEKEASNG